jgi:hypothetical protein
VIHRYIPKAARAKVDGSLRWISFFLIVLCPKDCRAGWLLSHKAETVDVSIRMELGSSPRWRCG